MATLTTLRAAVAGELGLDNTASSTEQGLIDGWLNEAVEQVLVRTHCHVSFANISLTADTKDYHLPTGIIAIRKVVDSDSVPLVRESAEMIHELRRSSGASDSAMRYAIDGANLLMVYPTPSSSSTLTFYYVPRPTVMSSGSHDPSSVTYGRIPAEHHRALEFYACARGASYDDDESSAQGKRYWELYDQAIRRMSASLNAKGGRKASRARLARNRFVPHSPSQDIR